MTSNFYKAKVIVITDYTLAFFDSRITILLILMDLAHGNAPIRALMESKIRQSENTLNALRKCHSLSVNC